jgi:hypothetical protein
MNYEKIEGRIFENHAEYSRYLSIDGMRVSNGATKPSIYITELKLNNALKTLSDVEIESIFEKEMTSYNCNIHREKIKKKIDLLQEWQLLRALSILLDEGRYDSILYVSKCKRTDKENK